MKKRGISIIGIIVLVGLIALIIWGLNHIIAQDSVVAEMPTATVPSNNVSVVSTPTPAPTSTPITVQFASSTPTSAPATTTPAKTPVVPKPPVTPPPAPTPPSSSPLAVTFTDKGFSPTSLTVKKGQTVTFVNNSSSKVWVAANPFPTSSEYPAFNEKAGMASGASWAFTFTQVGTWFYHNHYSPAQGAKIVVSP